MEALIPIIQDQGRVILQHCSKKERMQIATDAAATEKEIFINVGKCNFLLNSLKVRTGFWGEKKKDIKEYLEYDIFFFFFIIFNFLK